MSEPTRVDQRAPTLPRQTSRMSPAGFGHTPLESLQRALNNSPTAQRLASLQTSANTKPRPSPKPPLARPAPPVQRYLDGENRMPAGELASVDGFLHDNGFDPNLFSPADYATLTQDHANLVALHGDDANHADLHGQTPFVARYDTVLDWATDHRLEDGSNSWTAAVQAGATHYEANAAAGYNAAALATWPGRNPPHPAGFEVAITDRVAANVAQRNADIAAAYQAYRGDGRLLAGTIDQIKAAIPNADIATVNARLATVYAGQINVTRQNWLTHLGVAGNNMDGPNGFHITTFNNAVTTDGITLNTMTVAAIMDVLFATVNTTGRIHASRKGAGPDNRKYYSGAAGAAGAYYQAGVAGIAPAGQILVQLDAKYTEMIQTMTAKVTQAKQNHGRIGANARGQQNVI